MSIAPSAADLLQASLLGLRGVSSKRLFGDQAFFVAGRMFAFRHAGALVVKLPETERQDVIALGHGRPFIVHENVPFGRWVEVKLRDLPTAIGLARLAHAAARVADATCFFLLGKLIEMDKTEKIFTMPSDKRTEDYITGRFG